jgi:predicted porin
MKIPGLEKMRIFAKYENFDPNTKKTNDGVTTYIAGISYDVTRELMPFFAYENKDFESATGADYTKYQVGFQFNF